MEKELKISELAQVWGVSIPTVWKNVEKMGLKTFKKKDENNRNVHHIIISEEQIKSYLKEDVVNLYKGGYKDNKVYKEDLQRGNENLKEDVINPNENIVEGEYVRSDKISNYDMFDKITELNKEFINVINAKNNEVVNLYKELINVKSEQKLLEDKASREGLYLNEINELKKENKGYKGIIKWFITFIIVLFICLAVCTFFLFKATLLNNDIENSTINNIETLQNK